MIVGLGASQVMAAPSRSGSSTGTGSGSSSVSSSRATLAHETVNGPPGVTGDNDWMRPDCLQRNVPVQNGRGIIWERAPNCPG
jgi:hypothetical protein